MTELEASSLLAVTVLIAGINIPRGRTKMAYGHILTRYLAAVCPTVRRLAEKNNKCIIPTSIPRLIHVHVYAKKISLRN